LQAEGLEADRDWTKKWAFTHVPEDFEEDEREEIIYPGRPRTKFHLTRLSFHELNLLQI